MRIQGLVNALATLSPLARTKIKETLADGSVEVTWNYWTRALDAWGDEKPTKACGCLMMDGYLKENPPEFKISDSGGFGGKRWVVDESVFDWEAVLVPFYEMDEYPRAAQRITDVANAYDNYVKWDREGALKLVRGVQVLRVAARRELIKLVEQADERAAVQNA